MSDRNTADPDALRPGERAAEAPAPQGPPVHFIGRIETPWATRDDCPRQGSPDGPDCAIEVFEPWAEALLGVENHPQLLVLYWLDRARRDLLLQSPRRDGRVTGTFSLRSPVRPNPIGVSSVALIRREGPRLIVRGLDCVDGTPLIDLKPDRCHRSPDG